MTIARPRTPDSSYYRNNIVRKLAKLMALLQSRRYMPTWREMAEHCGCCERTMRRYVAALEEAHVVLPPYRRKDAA